MAEDSGWLCVVGVSEGYADHAGRRRWRSWREVVQSDTRDGLVGLLADLRNRHSVTEDAAWRAGPGVHPSGVCFGPMLKVLDMQAVEHEEGT